MTEKRIRIIIDSKQADLNAKKTDSNVKNIGKSADAAQFAVNKLAAAIAAAFAADRIVRFFAESVSAASRFQSAISDLSAITGATGEDLQFLSDAAREFGATTTLSATQAAEAIKLIASAKPDLLGNANALKAVTKEAIALAEAAGVDLPQAASTLGASLNQFNLEASESSRVINVLAAGAKFGSSEIQDTAEALKNAGVSAASASVSFETTNAAIQVLASNAIKGAEAGTGLRNVLTILNTSTDKDLRPSVVGLSGALEELAGRQLDNTKLVKLFGRENINSAQILLRNVDRLKDLEGQLKNTSIAYDQQKIKTDNLAGDVKQLGSAYEELQISIGETFTDSARGSVTDLTEATTFLAENLSSVVDIVEILAVAVGARMATAIASSAVAFVSSVRSEALAINQASAAAIQASASVNKFTGAITFSTVAAQRATVATQLMARASAVASRSLAFLGGPIGIIAVAAASFVAYRSQASSASKVNDDLTKSTDVLTESIEGLTKAQAESQRIDAVKEISAQEDAVSSLQAKLDRMRVVTKEGFQITLDSFDEEVLIKTEAAIDTATGKIEQLRERISSLNSTISGKVDPVDGAGQAAETSEVSSEVSNDALEDEQKTAIKPAFADQEAIAAQLRQENLNAIESEGAAARDAIAKAEMQSRLSNAQQLGGALMSLGQGQSRKVFKIGQKLALAQAAVALPSAVLQSFQNGGGFPWGLVPAGAMLANGLANINNIRKAGSGMGGGGGGSVPSISLPSGGTGGAPAPQAQTASSVESPEPQQSVMVVPRYDDDEPVQGAWVNRLMDAINEQQRNGKVLIRGEG